MMGLVKKLLFKVRDGLELRRSLISKLSGHLQLDEEPQVVSTGKFDGMTFCITGTLSQPRKAIQLMIKSLGGKVVSSISAKLDVLIAGENAGSKLAKAENLGITVWDEELLETAVKNSPHSFKKPQSTEENPSSKAQKSLLDF